MKTKILIFLGALLMTTNIYSQDPNFYIYLCFGQSNMEGQGTIQSQDQTVNSRFKVFQSLDCTNLSRTKGTWYTAVPPLCQCYSGLSPADYFGRTMVENLPDNITIGVINVAVGGCDIRLFDKDIYMNYDDTYNESWFLDKVAAYGGNPYLHLISLANQAKQDGVIKGILLHQGETNTNDENWPTYVKKIYHDMLTDLSMNAEDVPLLAGEVLSAEGNCCASMNNIINRLPDTIPTAHVISSEGCAGKDNAHFDSEGYRILGRRYGEKMLSLMGITVNVEQKKKEVQGFALEQSHPNPTKGSTSISFEIPKRAFVSLKIFNMQGAEVAEVAGKEYSQGKHTIEYNIEKLKAGHYFYTIKADKFTATKKMVITAK